MYIELRSELENRDEILKDLKVTILIYTTWCANRLISKR